MTRPADYRPHRQIWTHLAVMAFVATLAVFIAPIPAYGVEYDRTTGTPVAQPDSVGPGESVRWEIPITNTGIYPLDSNRLSTYVTFLPATLTFEGAEGGWSCSDYWRTEDLGEGTTSVLCSAPALLTLAPGETTHLAVTTTVGVEVTPGDIELGAFQNPWPWWGPWGCPPGNSPPSPPNMLASDAQLRAQLVDWVRDCGPVGKVTVALPTPEMTLSKSASVADVAPGDPLDWVIEVSNTGSGDAHDVVVVDEVPEGTEVLTDPTGCGVDGRMITCAAGDLAVGATLRIEIATLVGEDLPASTLDAGSVTNTASVTASDGNCQPTNTAERCSATAAVNLVQPPPPGGEPTQETGLDETITTTTTTTPNLTRVVDEPSTPSTPELPRTGAATGVAVALGAALIVTGFALVISTRRRLTSARSVS